MVSVDTFVLSRINHGIGRYLCIFQIRVHFWCDIRRRKDASTFWSMNVNKTANASPSAVSRRDMLAGTAGVLAASAVSSRAFAGGSKAGAAHHKPTERTGAKTVSFITTKDGTEAAVRWRAMLHVTAKAGGEGCSRERRAAPHAEDRQ
jgi:hypothetical protein